MYSPNEIGEMALNILKLPKAGISTDSTSSSSDLSSSLLPSSFDDSNKSSSIANLDDITEEESYIAEDEENRKHTEGTKIKKRTSKMVLPPVQVSRTINPNSNYYRKISADYHKKRDKFKLSMRSSITSPIHERLSILDQINATGTKANFTNDTNYSKKLPIPSRTGGYISTGGDTPSSQHTTLIKSKKNPFEWNHKKSLGPLKLDKHLNDSQMFWRQGDSVSVNKITRVALPEISKSRA